MPQVRSDSEALYRAEAGKSCPTEILEVLAKYNAEGRPIWKPMHMQPMYRLHECVGREGSLRCRTKRLYRRRRARRGRGHFPAGTVSAQRQQNDAGAAGYGHRTDPRLLRVKKEHRKLFL